MNKKTLLAARGRRPPATLSISAGITLAVRCQGELAQPSNPGTEVTSYRRAARRSDYVWEG
jgi:hypothetical protein